MTADDMTSFLNEFLDTSGNFVAADAALRPDLGGMRLIGGLLVGICAAEDAIFDSFRDESVIGGHFMLPRDWLATARSVVSVFFSFSDPVVDSNCGDPRWPSAEWLHARIEGQKFINSAMQALADQLRRDGPDAVVPSGDPRFETAEKPDPAKCGGRPYTSNWSERHVAYAAGLGTFGLSAGIITAKGMPGRIGSLVTSLCLSSTGRIYSSPYEYCVRCGLCADRCPADAIDMERGKDHRICAQVVDETKARYRPRYGCGKCQVKVPCQRRNPTASGG